MAKWNSSPHPISDLRDWNDLGRLELRPSFQRKEVWNPAARIMLIDTILREVPMPKMFLWNEVRKGLRTGRSSTVSSVFLPFWPSCGTSLRWMNPIGVHMRD